MKPSEYKVLVKFNFLFCCCIFLYIYVFAMLPDFHGEIKVFKKQKQEKDSFVC